MEVRNVYMMKRMKNCMMKRGKKPACGGPEENGEVAK
jgi:hypothetical protein